MLDIKKEKILKVYDYYDRPIFYSCSIGKSLYLVIWIDEDDWDNEYWLYVKVNKIILENLESGIISTRDALISNKSVNKLKINKGVLISQSVLGFNELTNDDLPFPDIFLSK